jgi:hypothetical protein
MLIGTKLLAKVKELGDVSASDLVRSAGYVSTKKDGIERLNFTTFYVALLEANGMHLGAGSSGGKGKPGRSLSYATKIHFNGNLMVGKAYIAQLGLKPGDEFEIKLGRKQIQLIPLGAAEEESGTAGVQWLGQDNRQFSLTPAAPVPPSRQRGRPIRSSATQLHQRMCLSISTPCLSSAGNGMAVWVDQRARSPNRVGYHPAVGRHLSDGIGDAATSVADRIVLIGR